MNKNWHKALLSAVLALTGILAATYALFFPEKSDLVGELTSESKGKKALEVKIEDVNAMVDGWKSNPQWIEPPTRHALFIPDKFLYFPDSKEIKRESKDILVGAYNQFAGFPFGWLEKYQLPYNDRMIAIADPDNDGFPNALEYLGKTDPKDEKSHPPYIERLRVKDLNYKPMYFRVTSVNEIDGKFLSGLIYGANLKGDQRRNKQVSTGDVIEGFTVGAIRRKTEKRKVADSDYEEDVEVSEVELENTVTETKLVARMNYPDTDASEVNGHMILIIKGPELLTPISIKQGADFDVKGVKYRFVRAEGGAAVIRDLDTKQEITIPKIDDSKDYEFISKPPEKPQSKKQSENKSAK